MLPVPSLHRALVRNAVSLFGAVLVAVSGIHPATTAAEVITYDDFDVPEFQKNYDEIQPPLVTSEDMTALGRAIEDAIRRAETQAVADTFRAAAENWHELSKQLDAELAAVTKQAKGRDNHWSRVGNWRGSGRRMGVAVTDGFRNAGASLLAITPFPVAALRTQRAVFPHSALRWDHASRTRNT